MMSIGSAGVLRTKSETGFNVGRRLFIKWILKFSFSFSITNTGQRCLTLT